MAQVTLLSNPVTGKQICEVAAKRHHLVVYLQGVKRHHIADREGQDDRLGPISLEGAACILEHS